MSEDSIYDAICNRLDEIERKEPPITNAESILQEADKIINGDRRYDYEPNESFNKICNFFYLLAGVRLTATQAAQFLMCVKLTRESFKHKRDNLVDLCGYAALLNEIEGE